MPTAAAPRDFFTHRLESSLLGPGSDTYTGDPATEVLDDFPLQRYYTGILFPDRAAEQDPGTDEEEYARANLADEPDEADDNEPTGAEIHPEAGVAADGIPAPVPADAPEGRDEYAAANHYFPSNLGLTCCVPAAAGQLRVTVRGASYRPWQAGRDHLAVRLAPNEWARLQAALSGTLRQKLAYDEPSTTLALVAAPKGNSRRNRSEDFAEVDRLGAKASELRNSPGVAALDKLLRPANRLWQRQPFEWTFLADLNQSETKYTAGADGPEGLVCWVKTYTVAAEPQRGEPARRYIKLLVHNAIEQHPAREFSNANEKLNEKSRFQVTVAASLPDGTALLPYKPDFNRFTAGDQEAAILNYQYRDCPSYGIGHGAAAAWEGSPANPPTELRSTFLPTVDVPGVSTVPRPAATAAQNQAMVEVLDLRNLSHWGKAAYPAQRLQELLTLFLDEYAAWTRRQAAEARQEPVNEDCYEPLLTNQAEALHRMRHAVTLLGSDPRVLDAFRLANTAMLLQMIVSDDLAYAGEPKPYDDFVAHHAATNYTGLEGFRNHPGRRARGGHIPFSYRPFQLAFLLISLNSVTVNEARAAGTATQTTADRLPDRELVDLIWFPTGGGKTEAYLAVTALAIIWRRWHGGERGQKGVAVLMRYTLRLLTTQQSERASRLMCALEFLRTTWRDATGRKVLGREPLTLGLWVGQATTPNTRAEAGQAYEDLLEEIRQTNYQLSRSKAKPKAGDYTRKPSFQKNVFQLASCPWCGCETISIQRGQYHTGFDATGQLTCLNERCHFGQRDAAGQATHPVPVSVVDEELYKHPPTLLFATVDKFAMLPHKEKAGLFFRQAGTAPPGLIIQDELHLLSGPLGSLTGLFERVVKELCTDPLGQRPPKIIASTATTRNTAAQVRALYDRPVAIFPPAGIRYDDSFFAYNTAESQRRHVGVMATGKTNLDMQLQLVSLLLLARTEAWRALRPTYATEADALARLDRYWTLVLYYNSLRDVGKMYNKVSSEVFGLLQAAHQHWNLDGPGQQWPYYGLMSRTRELTSRVESNKIKDALHELGEPLKLNAADSEQRRVVSGVDLVLASNMLSVGIDIGRLNLMVLCGQPRNSAEYIQASSRVARNDQGLVFSLLDANRAREKSIFEQYTGFNQTYYKHVEPLSLTPFTPQTLDRMLNSLLVTWVRHYKGQPAAAFELEMATALGELLGEQLTADSALAANLQARLANLAEDWLAKKQAGRSVDKPLHYKNKRHNTPLLSKEPGEPHHPNYWNLPTSMREVDTETTLGFRPEAEPVAAAPALPTI
ncbi:DEAD/DEAH box helicase [Hymenobacter ruricola]|uniref:Helicase C-terminal domain-containing protein n=1 Tax=Hymenobacter ruricola TaxID=2791023 RepID=A0ABS0I9M1_9BACT|nr:helicase-related protein [Hymenobacter ruricola]MBF9223640.1 hypothetical protein [Hymenobacter ruricola]